MRVADELRGIQLKRLAGPADLTSPGAKEITTSGYDRSHGNGRDTEQPRMQPQHNGLATTPIEGVQPADLGQDKPVAPLRDRCERHD